MSITMDIMELYSKPSSYKFNDQEIEFIKKNVPKSSFKIKYAIYKPKSYKGLYIGFFIDSEPKAVRRSGVENHWNFICEREISEIEYLEQIQNFGTFNRRFVVWQYKYIEQLIQEDLKYNIQTPEVFIKECKKLGYSGGVQIKMKLN